MSINLSKLYDSLMVDINSPFSVNALLSTIKKNAETASDKINKFLEGDITQVAISYVDDSYTGIMNFTQDQLEALQDNLTVSADVLDVATETVQHIEDASEGILNGFKNAIDDNLVIQDVCNSLTTTTDLQSFSLQLTNTINKYVSSGAARAAGMVENLQSFLAESTDDSNYLAAILNWIVSLSNGGFSKNTTESNFDPSNFFKFSDYSDMSPINAWFSSLNITLDWNSVSGRIAGACLTVIHGIEYLAAKTQQALHKYHQWVQNSTVDPQAFAEDSDVKSKLIASALDDRLYTFKFTISKYSMDSIQNPLNKLYDHWSSSLPQLSDIGGEGENFLTGAVRKVFSPGVFYHFDYPGCIVSLVLVDSSYQPEFNYDIIITMRPKAYTKKVSWYRDGISWSYPASKSDLFTSICEVATNGWAGKVTNDQYTPPYDTADHNFAIGLRNGSTAFAATELALLASCLAPNDDTIPASLVNWFTMTAMPAGAGDKPGFGVPGQSSFGSTASVSAGDVIDNCKNTLLYIRTGTITDYILTDRGFSPSAVGTNNNLEWNNWPFIALICCMIVKENGSNFVPYLKTNSDVTGTIRLVKTSEQAKLFGNFAKVLGLTAAAVVATVAAIAVYRKIRMNALRSNMQYEQFLYKSTTSNEDLTKLKKLSFKAKIWNFIAGNSAAVGTNTANNLLYKQSGSTTAIEGDRTQLIIDLIRG